MIVESTSQFRIYRTNRLAKLFGVDPSTIWKWRKQGILPPFVRVGRVSGLTEAQLGEVHEKLRIEAAKTQLASRRVKDVVVIPSMAVLEKLLAARKVDDDGEAYEAELKVFRSVVKMVPFQQHLADIETNSPDKFPEVVVGKAKQELVSEGRKNAKTAMRRIAKRSTKREGK